MRFFIGFMLGMLTIIGGIVVKGPEFMGFETVKAYEDYPAFALTDEFDGLLLCMRTEKCQMTARDFVRYYEIRRLLEITD